MLMFKIPNDKNPPHAPMLGDHLAMDLLNTKVRSGDMVVDYWESDADVLRWLRQNEIPVVLQLDQLADGELLSQAKFMILLS